MVKQLSSFAAAGPGIREVFSLQELIENTVELYRGVLGSKIELRTDINPDLPRIDGDKTKIQQVVTNLLVNAREAIGDRPGTVLMSGSVTYLQSNEIDPLLSPGDYVRLDVKDTGTGMNEEQRRRCFEPFYTTKDIDELSGVGVSGAGLGLSAAYSIVHQHGGHLVVDSAPGEGSTFGIYLPVHQERNSGVKDASAKPLVVVSKEDNVEPLSSTAGSSKVIPLSANTRVGNSG